MYPGKRTGATDEHDYLLDAVLTVKEVCKMWYVSRGKVIRHLDRGEFASRLTDGGSYLIARHSVVALLGPPLRELYD